MQTIVLEATGVTFKNILKFPPISILENQTTFITGKSGSGKSTLLKVFNATLPIAEGTILYRGKTIEEMNTLELRKKVLLVNQTVYLEDISIKENYEMFYQYRQQQLIPDETIKEFLSLCCADFSLDTNCGNMSGGERQRVFISIFLSFMPDVILLDEPTAALDETTGDLMMQNIITFCKQKKITPIIISHDQKLVTEHAENNIILEKK